MTRHSLNNANLPTPVGYARAVRASGAALIVTSMTAPVGADGDVIGVRDIRLQTQTALGNIADILEQNGGTLADVAKVTAYVVEQKDLASVMTVIAEVFGDSPPAVAVVVVGGLPNKDFLVELDAIAMI